MADRSSIGAENSIKRRMMKRQRQPAQSTYTPPKLPDDIEEAVQKFFQMAGQEDGTQK